MKITTNLILRSALIVSGAAMTACSDEWLDVRRDKSLIVPTTLEDFQLLLDSPNEFVENNTPTITLNAVDDFFVTDAGWNALGVYDRTAYIWELPIDEVRNFWAPGYRQVFYANIVLEGLDDMEDSKGTPQWNALKGSALFYRSYAFFCLAQLFTRPYVMDMDGQDPGIPLRLSSDFAQVYPRGTVKEVYEQITTDLSQSVDLLPDHTAFRNRPTKQAAHALLARVYLAIGAYDEADMHAQQALAAGGTLLDYNTVDPTPARPFPVPLPEGNDEVIWFASSVSIYMRTSNTFVDTLLYASYEDTDLRKQLFFTDAIGPSARFRGTYSGGTLLFTGLTTAELYLVRAECRARKDDTDGAMRFLNALLENRWKSSTFSPFVADSPEEALTIVLAERRKELTGRNTRWTDLRRLNQDPRFAVVQRRVLNGETYILQPDDASRYCYPFPQDEINQYGYEQN